MGRGQMFEPAIEAASRDELRSLQETRLSAQIARCTASPGIYRSQLDSVGAEPDDIRSLEDLARLPVLTKKNCVRISSGIRLTAASPSPIRPTSVRCTPPPARPDSP